MKNVYDQAHGLARALRESDEYRQYMQIKQEVSRIDHLRDSLADFQQKQFQMQTAHMTGQSVDKEIMEQIQRLYQILMTDPKAMEYLQAEMRFSQMVADVYKILGEVIQTDGK